MNEILLNGISVNDLVKIIKEELLNEISKNLKINQENGNDLINIDEACQLLNICKTTLWKHRRSGAIKTYGIGNKIFLKKSELLNSLKQTNL